MQDRFRKKYHTLNEVNQKLIIYIKDLAANLEEKFNLVNNREMSLALTNLEQTIMWATKAVVLHDEREQRI